MEAVVDELHRQYSSDPVQQDEERKLRRGQDPWKYIRIVARKRNLARNFRNAESLSDDDVDNEEEDSDDDVNPKEDPRKSSGPERPRFNLLKWFRIRRSRTNRDKPQTRYSARRRFLRRKRGSTSAFSACRKRTSCCLSWRTSQFVAQNEFIELTRALKIDLVQKIADIAQELAKILECATNPFVLSSKQLSEVWNGQFSPATITKRLSLARTFIKKE